ncbi:hypothetical protein IQ07DRAFT_650456 [Pyrenochaeta sp. DS3sAY3a]|nr:hypothetical protein IQ07DRAFT_650456 [Pyrenochaeta sp. DS3sAY3a]
MADRVGLAASVITIMGCVGITLRHLFIWGCLFFSREAEIDVKALQDLLDGTTLLLEEASRRRSTFPNPHLDINLVRAQRLVVQLKNILHQIRGSQNRSRLQFRLQALKDEVSNMHSMSLTKETVKTLHSINHGGHREITMLQDVSSKFSRQVEDWRTDALSTQLVSYGPTIPYRGFLAESLTAGHRSHLAISTNSLQASSDRIHPTGEDDQATHSACAQPVSKFELSKTFKPTKKCVHTKHASIGTEFTTSNPKNDG